MEVMDLVLAESSCSLSSEELVNVTCRQKAITQSRPPVVRALRARAGILLLITNEFSTEGLSRGVNTQNITYNNIKPILISSNFNIYIL